MRAEIRDTCPGRMQPNTATFNAAKPVPRRVFAMIFTMRSTQRFVLPIRLTAMPGAHTQNHYRGRIAPLMPVDPMLGGEPREMTRRRVFPVTWVLDS